MVVTAFEICSLAKQITEILLHSKNNEFPIQRDTDFAFDNVESPFRDSFRVAKIAIPCMPQKAQISQHIEDHIF